MQLLLFEAGILGILEAQVACWVCFLLFLFPILSEPQEIQRRKLELQNIDTEISWVNDVTFFFSTRIFF